MIRALTTSTEPMMIFNNCNSIFINFKTKATESGLINHRHSWKANMMRITSLEVNPNLMIKIPQELLAIMIVNTFFQQSK